MNKRRMNGLKVLVAVILLVRAGSVFAGGEGNNLPAEFTITKDVLVPASRIEPLGVNRDGDPGGCQFGENTFVNNPGNEPYHWCSGSSTFGWVMLGVFPTTFWISSLLKRKTQAVFR